MTDEEINIAIAKACGRPKGWNFNTGYPTDEPDEFHLESLPDYLNDLNAMHEAEKWVSEKCKEGDYWFFLRELLHFPEAESDWDKFYFFAAIHATAKQRAEAFLKTIEKWNSDKI